MQSLHAAAAETADDGAQARLTRLGEVADSLAFLSAADRAVIRYVTKLTVAPRRMTAADAEALRTAGFDDDGIFDVNQVACMFAYMNRLADGTGVGVEPGRHAFAIELFGEAALAAHLVWAGLD